MIRRLTSLRAANRGAAIIELAIVAPVIALLTVGVVDLSNGFASKLKLEQAAQRAIEKVMQTTGSLSVEGTITAEALCQYNGVDEDGDCLEEPITAANVEVVHRMECDGVVSTADECADGEVESKWLQITVWDDYEPLFPVHFSGIDAEGKYRVQAVAGMRTL